MPVLTIPEIIKLKGTRKIVMLTAYDYAMASFLEVSGVDIVLVGDSLGMVFSGHANTLPVTVEDIVYHVKAVKRGAGKTFITADMPFMSYQVSVKEALKNGGEIVKKAGADAVKLEGGAEIVPQIKALVDIGIPVMGHIGLQPQSVKKYGGYPLQATTSPQIDRLIKDAIALEKAGVFSIVLEKVKAEAAREITAAVKIPVIGIGAGPYCDGQVLVTQDLLGFFEDFSPKFVKKYESLGARVKIAVKRFAGDVRKSRFPGKKNYY